MRYFAGIDPGATGAIAILSDDATRFFFQDFTEDLSMLHAFIYSAHNECRIELAVLEKVHSMPKQGVASSFKFGMNFGIWKMALASCRIPFQLITPQRWRKACDSSVPFKPTKFDLRHYAIRRWPAAAEYLHRARDDGRAEALIMAEFARQTYLGDLKPR